MNDRRGVAGLREAFTCLCGAPGRLLGWRWLGGVLEAGAVFADFDVDAGGGLAGAGDGLPGAALVGAEFGFPIDGQGDGVVSVLAVIEISGGIGERGAWMVFTNHGGAIA